MLAISSGAYFLSKRIKVPHTVVLVSIGVVLGLVSLMPTFHFITDLSLTPELLFYIFLPTLIFESAFNMQIRHLIENITIVSILAIVSLLVSTALIAFGLALFFPLINMTVPFIILLLFASLISATDPVAVLALFKEYGVPRRLSLIFEGESLFNDATAVALFLIVLEVVESGFHGMSTVLNGILIFAMMIVGGIIYGLIMGGFFAKLVGWANKSDLTTITLTIVLAHFTFITSEFITHSISIGGFPIHLSSIIATTVASLVMGNYGRAKISPKAEEFVVHFWEEFAFIANSLVFLLIGSLFISLPVSNPFLLIPIAITIFVVATSRALSIYPVVNIFNRLVKRSARIPASWQHLLSWGSLRGALAITMVLIVPPELTVPGLVGFASVQEFLLALTVGCIFATLFIKATTISAMIERLKLNALTTIEKLEEIQARALIHSTVLKRLNALHDKKYIDDKSYGGLMNEHQERYKTISAEVDKSSENLELNVRTLRMHAIGIERKHLRELYSYGEVSERVFKRIWGKLAIQFENIERGIMAVDESKTIDKRDVFEHLAEFIRVHILRRSEAENNENQYLYYRAQTIIARKVLKELQAFTRAGSDTVVSKAALGLVLETYESFRKNSEKKKDAVAASIPKQVSLLNTKLARKGIFKVEETVLNELYERELITPKVYIALKNDLEEESIADKIDMPEESPTLSFSG